MKTEEREHLLKTFGLINCSTCGSTKHKSAFGRDKSKAIGYNTQCKQCKKEYRTNVSRFEKDEIVPANVSWFQKFKMWLTA